MAQKEKQLTAAEIAARRPQAAKTMKRKDGSTYSLGVSYGGAPKTSPKPKTRPAPVKTTKSTKSPVAKDAMKGYRKGDVIGVGAKADWNVGTGTATKRSVTGMDGKTVTEGKAVVGKIKQYAKGGMVKGKKC